MCEQCGRPIERFGKRFCSPSCASRSRRTNLPKPCQYCCVDFTPKWSKSKFCSRECADAGRARKTTVPTDTCLECHKPLTLNQIQRRQLTCGRSCAQKYRLSRRPRKERITVGGYIFVWSPGHPFANSKGRVAEHRLVMEKHLGRYLQRHEQVHHKDGKRNNNDLSNLELWKHSQPSGVRARDYHCPGCNCGPVILN